jgi:hypothetical protein
MSQSRGEEASSQILFFQIPVEAIVAGFSGLATIWFPFAGYWFVFSMLSDLVPLKRRFGRRFWCRYFFGGGTGLGLRNRRFVEGKFEACGDGNVEIRLPGSFIGWFSCQTLGIPRIFSKKSNLAMNS